MQTETQSMEWKSFIDLMKECNSTLNKLNQKKSINTFVQFVRNITDAKPKDADFKW